MSSDALHVLVVNADHHAAARIAEVLGELGHHVRCATSAAAALRAARSHRLDVIFIASGAAAIDPDAVVRQVRALYPVHAVRVLDHLQRIPAGALPGSGFDGQLVLRRMTPDSVLSVLRHAWSAAESSPNRQLTN